MRMRTSWIPLALAAAVVAVSGAAPAGAANQTVVLKLKHLSAGEAEGILLTSARQVSPTERSLEQFEILPGLADTSGNWYIPGSGGGGDVLGTGRPGSGAAPRPLLPEGILALTANERQRTLQVTGTESAIRSLKSILRLLDIPARQIRLSIQALRLGERDLQALRAEKVLNDAGAEAQVAALKEEQAALLLARAPKPLAEASLTVTNNRPARLFMPSGTPSDRGQATIVPRLNGDGSVTLMASVTVAGPKAADRLTALRRIQCGQSLIAVHTSGMTLLVKATLLPE